MPDGFLVLTHIILDKHFSEEDKWSRNLERRLSSSRAHPSGCWARTGIERRWSENHNVTADAAIKCLKGHTEGGGNVFKTQLA